MTNASWMIWRADTDKAHRCPLRMSYRSNECPKGYVSSEETGWRFKRLHVYRCGDCGLKVTTFPGWPHHPDSGETYWSRFRWFWTRGIRYKISWQWERQLSRRLRRWRKARRRNLP